MTPTQIAEVLKSTKPTSPHGLFAYQWRKTVEAFVHAHDAKPEPFDKVRFLTECNYTDD